MATRPGLRWAAVAVTLCGLGYLLSSACAGAFSIPGAGDAEEGRRVCESVRRSGAVPAHGTVAWRAATRDRPLLVYGIEDPAEQEAILHAAREARSQSSTLPVRVVFHRARVVHDGHGGATFPDGTTVIRTETIP